MNERRRRCVGARDRRNLRMKSRKKISKSRVEESKTTSSKAKAATGDGKVTNGAKLHHPKKAVPKRTNSEGPYRYRRVTYKTKAALIVGYLDAHKVFTGMVRPPNVAEFERDTGVHAGHGMYGARLHEYCHAPRADKDGTYTVDRRALRAGGDGRVFQNPTRPTPGEGDEVAK
jgi:hypothetical protein